MPFNDPDYVEFTPPEFTSGELESAASKIPAEEIDAEVLKWITDARGSEPGSNGFEFFKYFLSLGADLRRQVVRMHMAEEILEAAAFEEFMGES